MNLKIIKKLMFQVKKIMKTLKKKIRKIFNNQMMNLKMNKIYPSKHS